MIRFKTYRFCILALMILSITACSHKQPEPQIIVKEKIKVITIQDPGAVQHVWEPPMVDVVDVPPGLDPEGNYYRPSHQEIVEIRQGKWKYSKPKK